MKNLGKNAGSQQIFSVIIYADFIDQEPFSSFDRSRLTGKKRCLEAGSEKMKAAVYSGDM